MDAQSLLVHTVIGTAANVHDINAAQALLHGEETDVYADVGYQGIEKREQARPVRWHVPMRPGKRRKVNLKDPIDAIYDQIEGLKAGIRAKVEHPFRVLKRTVRLHENAIPGADQKHCSNHDVVWVGQSVDGP